MSANEFEILVSQIQDDQLERLDLYGSDLGEERIMELVKLLKGNKSVKVVSLGLCGLGLHGFGSRFARVMSDVLRVNTILNQLHVYGNYFGSNDARSIAEGLKVNTSLTTLNIEGNYFGDEGTRAIAEALLVNQSIKLLFLGLNGISVDGARAISQMLRVNRSVQVLSLCGNGLGTEGAQAVSEALNANQTLKDLNLCQNNIGDEGKRALLDALRSNGSLTGCHVDEYQSEVNVFCKRNKAMHEKARESVVHLLALRRMGRIVWIPKEMMLMIAKTLWRTKIDLDVWM